MTIATGIFRISIAEDVFVSGSLIVLGIIVGLIGVLHAGTILCEMMRVAVQHAKSEHDALVESFTNLIRDLRCKRADIGNLDVGSTSQSRRGSGLTTDD
jgi:hypothetical protein